MEIDLVEHIGDESANLGVRHDEIDNDHRYRCSQRHQHETDGMRNA